MLGIYLQSLASNCSERLCHLFVKSNNWDQGNAITEIITDFAFSVIFQGKKITDFLDFPLSSYDKTVLKNSVMVKKIGYGKK